MGSLKSSGDGEELFANNSTANLVDDFNDFNPEELLNAPLFNNSIDKLQGSSTNELSFGTFQSDSLPSSSRDLNADVPTPASSYYNNVASGSEPIKQMLHVTSAASIDSPGSIDSFANEEFPGTPESRQGPPVSQLTIPSGSFLNQSSQQYSNPLSSFDHESLNSNLNMQPDMLYSGMQQQQPQQQQGYSGNPMGMPPQIQSTQQFNDMQAMQLLQMQTDFSQQQQLHHQQQFQQQQQLQQQQFQLQQQLQQPQQQQQQQQQQHQQQFSSSSLSDQNSQIFQGQGQVKANYVASFADNQALPSSVRISPSGRSYPGQVSVSMGHNSQMRSIPQSQQQQPQQQLPYFQNLDHDASFANVNGSNLNYNSSMSLTSQSLHGGRFGNGRQMQQQQPFTVNNMQQPLTVNQSLSRSLHEPLSQQRTASFHGTPTLPPTLSMPLQASTTPGAPPPSINDAMAHLCDSMRRSAMSRSFVKQLSGRSLTGQTMQRSIGRTNSLHSQNSSRSLMDDASGRSLPVRRTSSSTKYHIQHPLRGIHRHDSQQSLSRSNHSTAGSNISFD